MAYQRLEPGCKVEMLRSTPCRPKTSQAGFFEVRPNKNSLSKAWGWAWIGFWNPNHHLPSHRLRTALFFFNAVSTGNLVHECPWARQESLAWYLVPCVSRRACRVGWLAVALAPWRRNRVPSRRWQLGEIVLEDGSKLVIPYQNWTRIIPNLFRNGWAPNLWRKMRLANPMKSLPLMWKSSTKLMVTCNFHGGLIINGV